MIGFDGDDISWIENLINPESLEDDNHELDIRAVICGHSFFDLRIGVRKFNHGEVFGIAPDVEEDFSAIIYVDENDNKRWFHVNNDNLNNCYCREGKLDFFKNNFGRKSKSLLATTPNVIVFFTPFSKPSFQLTISFLLVIFLMVKVSSSSSFFKIFKKFCTDGIRRHLRPRFKFRASMSY